MMLPNPISVKPRMAQRMGHPQDLLLGGVREIEEHRPFGFAQGGQECLCHRELEEFYGYALGGVAYGDQGD